MNEFENVNKLWLALGGFAELTPDLKEIIQTLILVEQQTKQEKEELINSLSRHDIDVFRKKIWYPLTLPQEDRMPVYDSGDFFDNLGTYDQYTGAKVIELPDYVVSADFYSDGINTYSFRKKITSRYLEVPEDLGTVWLHNALINREDLYHQFGYAIGLRLPSSEQYKQLINAIFDSLVNGPSYYSLMSGISAMTGIPVVINNCTVTSIDDHHVTTSDGKTYNLPENSTITVKEGDSLKPGDTLCDGFEITNDVAGITLDKEYTGLCQTVTFLNQDEKILVSKEDGFTRVDVPSLGKEFNDLAHQLGCLHSQYVTDPCELYKIERIRGKHVQPIDYSNDGGLSKYIVVHRFA